MKKIQQGFTLIELMIVVAIIGILAAVAIPSYQDYTARAQVTEAVSLAAAFKTSFAEYYADRGQWPANLAEVGGTTEGKYVQSVEIESGDGGTGNVVIKATLRSAGVNAAIRGSFYAIGSSDGGMSWPCGNAKEKDGTTDGPAKTVNNVESKYLPGACK